VSISSGSCEFFFPSPPLRDESLATFPDLWAFVSSRMVRASLFSRAIHQRGSFSPMFYIVDPPLPPPLFKPRCGAIGPKGRPKVAHPFHAGIFFFWNPKDLSACRGLPPFQVRRRNEEDFFPCQAKRPAFLFFGQLAALLPFFSLFFLKTSPPANSMTRALPSCCPFSLRHRRSAVAASFLFSPVLVAVEKERGKSIFGPLSSPSSPEQSFPCRPRRRTRCRFFRPFYRARKLGRASPSLLSGEL